jgi:hypothetical protein
MLRTSKLLFYQFNLQKTENNGPFSRLRNQKEQYEITACICARYCPACPGDVACSRKDEKQFQIIVRTLQRPRCKTQKDDLVFLQRPVAWAAFVAFVIVRQFAVQPKTRLRFVAPEEAVIPVWDRRVPLGGNEHTLPSEIGATVFVDIYQTGPFHSVMPSFQLPRAMRVLLLPEPAAACIRSG